MVGFVAELSDIVNPGLAIRWCEVLLLKIIYVLLVRLLLLCSFLYRNVHQ